MYTACIQTSEEACKAIHNLQHNLYDIIKASPSEDEQALIDMFVLVVEARVDI